MASNAFRKLVVISSDVKIRRQVSDLASKAFQVFSTPDAQQGLAAILSDASTAVVVIDHATAGETGVGVLERVRASRPGVRRVLLAEAEDFASLIVGLHSGAIEQVVHRPIDPRILWRAIYPEVTAVTPIKETFPARGQVVPSQPSAS